MWQYTTETIINSNKGHLGADKTKRFDVQAGKLLIEGVGAFDITKIKNSGKVWKRAYQPAVPASGELAVPAGTVGHVYRLQVWVSEEGTIRPELQNAMLMKSLPFHFEVEAVDGEALEVTLAKAVKKTFSKKGAEKLFTATSSTKKLTLTATDCYVRIDQVRLDEVPNTTTGYIDLTGYQNYTPVSGATWTESTRGTEGNGTVARLVKNLRLPTKTSLDPFGADQGGKPVPGGKYNQYMFEYVTDRSHVGHQVFGSVGDQSLTTHILFIEGYDEATSAVSGAAAEFETLLSGKGITVATYAPSTPSVSSAKEGRGAKK